MYEFWLAVMEYANLVHLSYRRGSGGDSPGLHVVLSVFFAIPTFGILLCGLNGSLRRRSDPPRPMSRAQYLQRFACDGVSHRYHLGLILFGLYSVTVMAYMLFWSHPVLPYLIHSQGQAESLARVELLFVSLFVVTGLLFVFYLLVYQCGRWLQPGRGIWSKSSIWHLAAFAAIYPCWHRGCIWMLQTLWIYEEQLSLWNIAQ